MTKEEFLEYKNLGFEFLSIKPDKTPLLKRKDDYGNPIFHNVSYSKVDLYAIVPPDDIVILDVDVKNGAQGAESLKKLCQELKLDLSINVQTPSGGLHFYCKVEGSHVKYNQKNYPGIDFISRNEFTVSPYAVAGNQELAKGKYKLISMKLNKIKFNNSFTHKIEKDDVIKLTDIFPKLSKMEIVKILKWIPSDDYMTWISNGAAIKSALGEDGFLVFLEWSQKSEKFVSRADCKAKWDSFSENYSGIERTVGSLIYEALQNKFDAFIAKLKTCKSWHEINALVHEQEWRDKPNFSRAIIENDINKAIYSLVKEIDDEYIQSKKRVYQQIQKMTKVLTGKAYEEVIEVTDDLRFSNFVRVNSFTRNQYYQLDNGARHDEATLEFLLRKQLKEVSLKLELKKTLSINQAFKLGLIEYVSEHEYNPKVQARVFQDEFGKKILNLFDPKTLPEPSSYTSEGKKLIQKFVQHLRIILGENNAEIFLDFLAYITQNPGKKVLWAPLIQSSEGLGKSVIGQLMINHIFGHLHSGVVDVLAVTDKNNSWATSKMLRILEEIKLSGHNRYEILNYLKPIITNAKITRVEKFEVSREVNNTCNFIAFTNFKDALPMTETDRRWWIVFSPIKNLAHLERVTKVKKEEYFKDIYKLCEIDSAYGSEFKRYLLERVISPNFSPNFPPLSDDKSEAIDLERLKIELLEELEQIIKFVYKENKAVINMNKLIEASMYAKNEYGLLICEKKLTRKSLRSILSKAGYQVCKVEDNQDFYYLENEISKEDAIQIIRIEMSKKILDDFEDLEDFLK